jgi:hypothetical protein
MNIEFLNLMNSPQEGYCGRKEKNRGDQLIRITILNSYLKQTSRSLIFIKQRPGPVWGIVHWKERGYKERLQEGQHGGNTMYIST